MLDAGYVSNMRRNDEGNRPLREKLFDHRGDDCVDFVGLIVAKCGQSARQVTAELGAHSEGPSARSELGTRLTPSSKRSRAAFQDAPSRPKGDTAALAERSGEGGLQDQVRKREGCAPAGRYAPEKKEKNTDRREEEEAAKRRSN